MKRLCRLGFAARREKKKRKAKIERRRQLGDREFVVFASARIIGRVLLLYMIKSTESNFIRISSGARKNGGGNSIFLFIFNALSCTTDLC